MTVLLLNASYEPLRVITLRRAIGLVFAGKVDLQAPAVKEAIAAAEAELAGRGRVLLRPSGTEPVVRVMVEGEERAHVQKLAEGIAAAVREGGKVPA